VRTDISDLELAVLRATPGDKTIVHPQGRTFTIYHARCIPQGQLAMYSGDWMREDAPYQNCRRMICIGCGGDPWKAPQ